MESAKASNPEQKAAMTSPLDAGKFEEWLCGPCRKSGYSSEPFTLTTIAPETMCDSMFAGLVDSAVEAGRAVEGSRFCVDRGFNTSSYQEGMVSILKSKSLSGGAFANHALSRLKSDSPSKDRCNWDGKKTLGHLADSCQWLGVMTAQGREGRQRRLERLDKIKDLDELKSVVVRGFADCAGYLTGFVAAGFFDTDPTSKAAYCTDNVPEGPSNSLDGILAEKLPPIAETIEELVKKEPGRAGEAASPVLFELVSQAFPCAGAGNGR